MTRLFRLQKLAAMLFAAATVLLFVNALYFMTEYKDLFGLELAKNAPVSHFHDVLMQGFNRLLLWFALFGVLAVVASFLLEVPKAVPDVFALAVMTLLLAAVLACSAYAMWRVPALREVYAGLDFQYLALEGAVGYEPRTATFAICFAAHALNAAVCVFFTAVLWCSHRKYRLVEAECVAK